MVRGDGQNNQTISLIQKNPHLVTIAAGRLGIECPEAERSSKEIPELNAVYFWTPVRGGGALLVGEDESVLFAHSSVPYDVHIAAFKDGRRTDRRINPVFGVLAGSMKGQSDRRALNR
jgi:hypothetical protein